MKKNFLLLALLLTASVGAASAQEAPRYGVKSGIITMESQMGTTTVYFDDFGALEAQKMKMSGFGADMEMTILRRDGKTYMINATEKQVQEMPAMGADVNYLKLTDKDKSSYKIKELGKETVLDRECTKYSMETSQMGMSATQTVWVWNGITLKSLTDAGEFQFGSTAVKFEENAEIPASTFDIPKF